MSQTARNVITVNIVLQTVLTCFKDIEEYCGCRTCNSFDDQLQIY